MQNKSGTTEAVAWQHTDASGASYRETNGSGSIVSSKSAEVDPLGRDAGTYSPYNSTPPQRLVEYKTYPGYGDPLSPNCVSEGISIPCSMVTEGMVRCPNNDCGPRRLEFYVDGQHTGSGVSMPFQAFADGYAGFLPQGAKYLGRGEFRYGKNMPGITFLDGPTKGRLQGKYSHAVQQKSACATFVDMLVKVSFGPLPIRKVDAGRLLVLKAVTTYGGEISKTKFRIDGFKQELVEPYQRGDVYKHILGHAGAILIGDAVVDWGILRKFGKFEDWSGKTGYQIEQEEDYRDVLQSRQDILGHPSEEAKVELLDNEAGRQVGAAMGKALDGDRGPRELKAKLMDILCDH